ncbi:MAG: ATP-binding protein [Bacteroidota bacterium]
MAGESIENLNRKIEELESRLEESEQLIEAIKAGEVDAFAVNINDQSEVFTLQSGDYAYRVLIEKFGEGAVNLTEDGLIVYSNSSFAELLNLPYEKVLGSMLIDFVDADSKSIFKELFAQSLQDNSKGELNISANGKVVPVYMSFTSLRPNLSTIGVIITDLSEKKGHEEAILKYQNDLEIKNMELLQINAELASFAYVASHDLQEPLRKINTFINLILAKEKDGFSPATTDYFRRIVSAAERMHNLIVALLDYSRTTTLRGSYSLTNLNVVVEDIKSSFRDQMDANKIVIESSKLPTLNVISFQFQQLFSNLISNAIKYRNPAVPLVIKITAGITSAKEIQQPEAMRNANYWKIQIADNGIGFEQKYADKIFELFQRLHGKGEYEGTGIGLAICKKIVQNHEGFIKAIGNPGFGSTFTVYLPVNP